ncbi:MAG: methylated-DNA--[protein]-cysteine S-methyltransferase [Gammaproteobacteria bacterium]
MASSLTSTHDTVFNIPSFHANPKLGIRIHGQSLSAIDFLPPSAAEKAPETELAHQVVTELLDYFANPARSFSFPVNPQGTAFQQRVWQALRQIPAGDVCSYGQLAGRLNTGARALGNACRYNPIPIVIPCHRIVAANGMGGYSGQTSGPQLTIKSWLLAHESRR